MQTTSDPATISAAGVGYLSLREQYRGQATATSRAGLRELSGSRKHSLTRRNALRRDHWGTLDARRGMPGPLDHWLLQKPGRRTAVLALQHQMTLFVTRPERVTMSEDTRRKQL